MTRQELRFFVALVNAIAEFEGFYLDRTSSGIEPRARRNKNPGNLRPYAAIQPRDPEGYRIFDLFEDGWMALARQAALNVSRGLTVTEFFAGGTYRDKSGNVKRYAGYAPAADQNHPLNYAKFVASRLKISVDSRLSDHITHAEAIWKILR